MHCEFCNHKFKNPKNPGTHKIYCSSNPNRKEHPRGMLGRKGSNQHTNGTAKPLSAEGRKRIGENNSSRVWTSEMRSNHSALMKRAVVLYPESYSASNRGRTKCIEKHGVKFQGKWELEFFEWCQSKSILVERCSEWFPYTFDGDRQYNPDFYLRDLGVYVEVKGFQTKKDEAKWMAFPHKLLIVKKSEINRIKKNTYTLDL
jgi:hypothetical protein